MKKLLFLVLLVLVSARLYAWQCDLYTSTYKTTLDAVEKDKIALCGAVKYYSGSGCKDTTPSGFDGGFWGQFKDKCLMEKTPGSCMLYDSAKAEYNFLCSATYTAPPPVASCSNIACVKSDGLEKMQKKFGKGCSDAMKAGIELDTETVLLLLITGGAIGSTYVVDDIVRKKDKDSTSESLCSSYCKSYWSMLDAIKSAQAALDSIDMQKLCPCDEQCTCEKDTLGAWVSGNCICGGLRGQAGFDECVCTKKTPAGVWTHGHCYTHGVIDTPEYGDNNNGATTSAANTNSSGGTGQSASTSGEASASPSSDAGSGTAGTSDAISGKGWLQSLKDSLGVSTVSGGSKFASGGSKGTTTLSGLGGEKNNTPTQGIASKEQDLFGMVATTYNNYENKGVFMEYDAVGTNSSSSDKKPISTKPHIYK